MLCIIWNTATKDNKSYNINTWFQTRILVDTCIHKDLYTNEIVQNTIKLIYKLTFIFTVIKNTPIAETSGSNSGTYLLLRLNNNIL